MEGRAGAGGAAQRQDAHRRVPAGRFLPPRDQANNQALDQAVPGAHHAGFRDRIRLATAADTLVLSGSALPFADAAADFFDLADTGPGRDGHVCAELHPGSGLLERSMPLMHVEYRADWEPTPRHS